ncbi:holo-ACP synthase [Aquibacillus kalidii]|uniref:holo-ACP synthase n=1 Tax=Aquibacillus kalidii TaxID=2762597 RepID=UPI0016487011|nr:holo-ACP synthase [Aquibacillus kalidii]
MIAGIGIDIIEFKRIEKSLRKSDRLVNRVLTDAEKAIYIGLESERRKIEFFAGRFAAKEACAKAFGTGIGSLSFQDIEVLPDSKGAPKISVKDRMFSIFVSISHSESYAIAQVILEK